MALILIEAQTVAAYSQALSNLMSQIYESNYSSSTCQTTESTLSSPS